MNFFRNEDKKFQTICIVGIPKSGTTYLLDFFTSGNFENIVNSNKEVLSLMGNNHKYNKFKHCCAKNPKIIYDVDSWKSQLLEFESTAESCLFIVCLRPYNEALYSLCNHCKRNRKISTRTTFERFVDSYLDTYLKIEDNIMQLKNTVKNLVVLDFENSIISKNTYEILKDLGVDFSTEKEKKWHPHEPQKKPESIKSFDYLDKAYNSIKNNPAIRSITYQNKKYIHTPSMFQIFCKLWRHLNS